MCARPRVRARTRVCLFDRTRCPGAPLHVLQAVFKILLGSYPTCACCPPGHAVLDHTSPHSDPLSTGGASCTRPSRPAATRHTSPPASLPHKGAFANAERRSVGLAKHPRAVQNHRHPCWCQAEDGSRRLIISPAVDCADGTLRVGVGWGGCVLFCFGIPSVCSYACERSPVVPNPLPQTLTS